MKKELAIVIAFILIWNQFLLSVSIAKAEENTVVTQETENKEQSQLSSPQTQQNTTLENSTSNIPSPTLIEIITSPTPIPIPIITTDDANYSTETDIIDNLNVIITEGTITSDGCTTQNSIPCDINTHNASDSSERTDSKSNTGNNFSSNTVNDTSIKTGTASAESLMQDLINVNIIEASLSGNTRPTTIDLSNNANHQATTSAISVSGQNESNGSKNSVSIQTNTSIAETNQVNIINTNIISKDIQTFLMSLRDENNQDIDLNKLWKSLNISDESVESKQLSSSSLTVNITNNANIDVSANATAISGENIAMDNAITSIKTGESIAVANIFNLINLNLIGSQFLFGVLNLYGSFSGNIIVPNTERFLETTSTQTTETNTTLLNNYTEVETNIQIHADSGSNSQSDLEDESLTGDAFAKANIVNYTNFNMLLSNWYLLFLNNFGFWTGYIESWENPNSTSVQTESTQSYQKSKKQELSTESHPAAQSTSLNKKVENSLTINNNALIKTSVSTYAKSGGNTTKNNQSSSIKTGRSVAVSNIFNFVNTNIIAGKLFMPILNIFGHWSGNLIFAYPKLEVLITGNKQCVKLGDLITYTIHYKNSGYEDARNSIITVQIPEKTTIQSINGSDYSSEHNKIIFSLGTVPNGTEGIRTITIKVDRTLTSNITKLSYATEITRSLVASVQINTQDLQSDTSKNTSLFTTYLLCSEPEESSENNQNTHVSENVQFKNTDISDQTYNIPQIEIESTNNTGEFVYPGDIVTFFVTAKNTGSGKANSITLYQTIMKGKTILTSNKFKIREIPGGQSKKLTFGLQIPINASAGYYNSLFVGEGMSNLGELFESNTTDSNFQVKLRIFDLIPTVVQVKKETGKVLGVSNTLCSCKKPNDNKIFKISIIIGVFILYTYLRKKQIEKYLCGR